MPSDPEDNFLPADPAQWPRVGGVPRIVVHPKPPPGNPASEVPGAAFDDGPDDWFVPPSSAAPSAWPAASAGGSGAPPGWPDPWAAFWSRIPANSAGALAWQPPIFLGDRSSPPPASLTPAWPSALPSPAGIPNAPTCGGIPGALGQLRLPGPTMFDSLAELGSPSPTIGGMFPSLAKLGSPGPTLPLGTMFDSLATLGSSSPNPGGALPPLPQPQFANAQADSLPGRRPLADYSTGEILADGGKSFGVGVGRFGIQGAGLLGDIRETIANSAQRAADYFAPGSAPNAGAMYPISLPPILCWPARLRRSCRAPSSSTLARSISPRRSSETMPRPPANSCPARCWRRKAASPPTQSATTWSRHSPLKPRDSSRRARRRSPGRGRSGGFWVRDPAHCANWRGFEVRVMAA
jgi:hypothetical protein